MTLSTMAASYHHSADLLRSRIRDLKERMKTAEQSEQGNLEQRIRELSAMYRETRATARALEHYYDRRRARQ